MGDCGGAFIDEGSFDALIAANLPPGPIRGDVAGVRSTLALPFLRLILSCDKAL